MTRNNQGPYKVAVTGGIGSGKSTVLAMIRERGYRVLSCDDLAREVTGEPRVLEALRARFGRGDRRGDARPQSARRPRIRRFRRACAAERNRPRGRVPPAAGRICRL